MNSKLSGDILLCDVSDAQSETLLLNIYFCTYLDW